MANRAKTSAQEHHIPKKPAYVMASAEWYWKLFTDTYEFEDAEAPRLAMLCNLYALAERCQLMSFSKNGTPLPLVSRGLLSGEPDDGQRIANPFIDELSGIQREIERVSAALGIMVREKTPVKPTVETPVDKATRRKAEKAAR